MRFIQRKSRLRKGQFYKICTILSSIPSGCAHLDGLVRSFVGGLDYQVREIAFSIAAIVIIAIIVIIIVVIVIVIVYHQTSHKKGQNSYNLRAGSHAELWSLTITSLAHYQPYQAAFASTGKSDKRMQAICCIH